MRIIKLNEIIENKNVIGEYNLLPTENMLLILKKNGILKWQ